MSADDVPLVDRARKGDRDAFGALVKKYQRRVYATAFHMTHDHGDADDVAQEAFVRAYRGLQGFDGRADFSTWLHRIVINVALNHLRARRRARLAGEPLHDDVAAANTPDPRVTAESRETVTAVVRALAELSPTLRITIILATIEEMPYKDIALALGVPEGTVAWRVNQARKVLRQRLAALSPDADQELEQGKLDEVLRRTKEALGAN
jgi:RNA polymerase sigma-70 factor (ECF subfamily)